MLTGLTALRTDEIKKVLLHLHRGDIQAPLTIVGLASIGLQDRGEHFLAHLRHLDAPAVHAVLTAVMAERLLAERLLAERLLAEGLLAARLLDEDEAAG